VELEVAGNARLTPITLEALVVLRVLAGLLVRVVGPILLTQIVNHLQIFLGTIHRPVVQQARL
jgi:hypothetical protein